MKTPLIIIVILILIAVVAYQGYQINQLKKEKPVVKEPEITINIQKQEPVKQKTIADDNLSSLEETIKQDFKKLFTDIFGNKQVQDGLKKGIDEFKSGLNDAVGQIQKELGTLSKNDSFFKDILKEFDLKSYKSFQDIGDRYELELDLPSKENSKLQLDVKNGFIHIVVDSKQESKNITKSTSQSFIVKVPSDSMIEMIKSDYSDGKVTITIPKIKDN